jgi:hypothetical protein
MRSRSDEGSCFEIIMTNPVNIDAGQTISVHCVSQSGDKDPPVRGRAHRLMEVLTATPSTDGKNNLRAFPALVGGGYESFEGVRSS